MSPDENFIPTGLPGGFFIYNATKDEEILFAEQNVVELFGCTDVAEFRELVGNRFSGMVHPDDLDKVINDINAQTFISDKRHDYVRYRIITKQGEVRYVEDFGHLLHGADGRKYFYVYIVDVDADEYYNRNRNSIAESQVLSTMNATDRLTGLMNMATFMEGAQDLVDDADARRGLTFAHFNIVSFKVFNEQYGFARGDDLLCRMAYTLRNTFPGSLIARFSNDHFVVCTPLSTEIVSERAEEVHATMAKIMENRRVEIKCGIYRLEDGCAQASVACDRARLACNTVKRRYDRVFAVYDAGLYERLRLQQYVVDSLDEALEAGYIKVFYQPIVRIATGAICGYEALVRWDDPHMGFLPPSQFITTLEEFHMVHKVDCFVIERVCRDMRALFDAGETVVPVSVNLSRRDFEQCDIVGVAERCRHAFDIDASLIDVEITESALNDDSTLMEQAVGRFREAGYRIWVDDFGSGYSALNSLLDYEFEVLKLDLEFLRTLDEHPRAGELISNIVRVARAMGVEPLQEGVEGARHLDFLRDIGCEMAQGYYFAHPMELERSRAFTRAKGLLWEERQTPADR